MLFIDSYWKSTLFPYLSKLEALCLSSVNKSIRLKWMPLILETYRWMSDILDIPKSFRVWIRKIYIQRDNPRFCTHLPNLQYLEIPVDLSNPNLSHLTSVRSLSIISYRDYVHLYPKDLPPNLTFLELFSPCETITIKGNNTHWPKQLATVRCYAEIESVNELSPWPPSVTNLFFNHYDPLDTLPSSVTVLTLRLTNGPLHNLPTSLTSLTLCHWDNEEITLPQSLTELKLDAYNLPRLPKFPMGLTELQLGTWNHPSYPHIFPVSLTRLTMWKFNQPCIHCHSNLQVLKLGTNVKKPIFIV